MSHLSSDSGLILFIRPVFLLLMQYDIAETALRGLQSCISVISANICVASLK